MTRSSQKLFLRLLSEPLLHFAVLGGLVFALYAALNPEQDQTRVIRLDALKRRELGVMFEQQHQRVPSDSELNEMIERWVVSEILFREGIELDLDRQDTTIREMVISKARATIQSRIIVEEPSSEQLTHYYETHREKYDQPPTRAISQVLVGPNEPDAQELAKNVQEALLHGEQIDRPVMTQEARPANYYKMVFGPEFSQALFQLPTAGWHLVRSRRGHHIVRVDAHHAAEPQPLSAIKKRVLLDFQNEEKKERYQKALAKIRREYEIHVSEDPS